MDCWDTVEQAVNIPTGTNLLSVFEVVRPNEPDQPDPNWPKFLTLRTNPTKNWTEIVFIRVYQVHYVFEFSFNELVRKNMFDWKACCSGCSSRYKARAATRDKSDKTAFLPGFCKIEQEVLGSRGIPVMWLPLLWMSFLPTIYCVGPGSYGHKGKPIHMYPCIKEWMSLLTGLEQEGSS